MGMKKLKKAAMIAAASMFVMMMPMIQTHAAPTDVIETMRAVFRIRHFIRIF